MRYSNINIIGKLQRWMDSFLGQTFLNYAYAWGASVVILGALFKLTHMPSANLWLFIGMGTEVLVFFISAFDRPFTNTTDKEEGTTSQVPICSPHSAHTSFPSPGEGTGVGITSHPSMPDTEGTDMLQEVSCAIYDVYRQQLVKLHGQLDSIDRIEQQMKIQTAYLTELNKVYGRMLDAVKTKE